MQLVWLIFLLYPVSGHTKASNRIRPTLPRGGVLYPRATESRDVLSLDGFWNFILDLTDDDGDGMREKWFEKNISTMADSILMPVPSSYNDITTSASVRDHVGIVWYQRTFFIPSTWTSKQQRIWLRFGGVHYIARVWVNGKEAMVHEIGHLPFQCEITKSVNFGTDNKVTVSVDNRLEQETVPHGIVESIVVTGGYKKIQRYHYGFYNYAGIHRSVHLYTTPLIYIDDVSLTSKFKKSEVFIDFTLSVKGSLSKGSINVSIIVLDKDRNIAGCQCQTEVIFKKVVNVSGTILIHNPELWWPYLMDSNPGYLYSVDINVTCLDTNITDVYRQSFGLRQLDWDHKSIYINKKPIYIRGISRHEDSDIRGRGVDLPTSLRDHNLLKWLGTNTYRTSNSPHAEETMDLAEQMGFMVINEVPSINTRNFTQLLLTKHRIALAELINRDKNRACVIMWSVANEPESETIESGAYFGAVVKFTKEKDKTRPVTAVINRWPTVDNASQWLDVICFNRFNGYYKEPGQLEMIQRAVANEGNYWYKMYEKPVIMSEYGTESYEGLHSLPEHLWTEEYQNKLLSEHFKAFDKLRKKGWFIGEIMYSFADIKSDESIKRVDSKQKKGVFTRQRQPKSSAYFIRRRNFKLAAEMNESSLLEDLDLYF